MKITAAMNGNNYKARPIAVKAFQYGIDPEPEWFKSAISDGRIMLAMYRFNVEDTGKVYEFEGGTILYESGGFANGSYVSIDESGSIKSYSQERFNELYEPAD